MSLSIQNSENLDFRHNCRKKLISFKNFDNLDFGQNYRKIVISVHYFRSLNFGQKFWKILISVKNSDNFDYGQNLRMEIHYRSKMRKISISDKIFVRCWYPAKIYFRKNSISVQNFENLDFGQNFRYILILVQSFDFEKSRFPSNVSKKIWCGPKFQKSLFR